MSFKYDIVCEDTGKVLGSRETEVELTPEQDEFLNRRGYLSEEAAAARAEKEQKAQTDRLKLKKELLTAAIAELAQGDPAEEAKYKTVLQEVSADIESKILESEPPKDGGGDVIVGDSIVG